METFDEMYPRYSQQTAPNFAVPTIHDSNVGLEEYQQGEALLPVIKRMSELMPSIAEARKTEKQLPPKKRSTGK